jgi:hypothetical protein
MIARTYLFVLAGLDDQPRGAGRARLLDHGQQVRTPLAESRRELFLLFSCDRIRYIHLRDTRVDV